MSDSDDDIGPGGSYYYSYRYAMSDAFITFFGMDRSKAHHRCSRDQLRRVVLNYADAHNGISNEAFHYDEALWNLFGIPANNPFKIRHLDDKIRLQRNRVRPCPICEKPSPFEEYCPNKVCESCIPAYAKVVCSKSVEPTDDLVEIILADMAITYTGPSKIIINGIKCKRRYSNKDVFEAIVHCPLCQAEVDEERRLGAFCDHCARSEELVDINGDRVRFNSNHRYDGEDFTYYDNKEKDGVWVLFYKKCSGEIVKQFHEGEFPCFFRGIECVAEDTGVHNMVIVRFRNKDTKVWDPDKDHIRIPAFTRNTQPTQKQVDALTLKSDWIYCAALF